MSDTRAFELFDELVELGPGPRETRLRELDAAQPALAAQLRNMLAADAAAGGPLDAGLPESIAPQLPDRSGQRVGEYRLLARLGRGGMGEVYRAERDAAGFTQRVALKLLRQGMDSEDIVRRFAQERRILARLEHPGIARLIDGGVSADGRPYLAMELVEGEPLTRYATSRDLDLRARVALVIALCESIDYAHRRLVVHRDLKPSNVLVGSDGQPRVLDFGIAKLLDEPEGEALTTTGARVLSPAYAAPEQLAGLPAGTATDVHALGLLLYELLTGTLPQGRTEPGWLRETGATERAIERPSSAMRRGESNRGTLAARALEGDLDTIVLKALAAEPDRRYVSAAALGEDLARWRDGRPVTARPDTARYRMAKFVRRHRGGVAASLLTLLALLGALVVSLWQAREARLAAARADAEAARAEAAAVTAREMTARARRAKDFLTGVFMQEDPIRRDARGALTMQEAFEDALGRIDRELGGDPALQGDLLDDFGEIVMARGDFDRAQHLLQRALALAESSRGPDDPAVAEALQNLSALQAYRGELAKAKPLLERALRILEPHADEDPAALANAMSSMTAVLRNEGDLKGAIAYSRRALALLERHGIQTQLRSQVTHNLASCLVDAGDYVEAERLGRQVMAWIEAEQGVDAPPLVRVVTLLELVARRQGREDEQRALVERRLGIARKAFPGDHPWTAAALAESGWLIAQSGDHATGEARIVEAIAMYERLGGLDIDAISARRRLAMSQNRRQDAAAASATMGAAAELCSASAMTATLRGLVVRANAIQLAAPRGAQPAMVDEAQAIADTLAANFGPRIDEVSQALEAKAAAQWHLGQSDAARATQAEAVAILREVYGDDHEQLRRGQERLDAMNGPAKGS